MVWTGRVRGRHPQAEVAARRYYQRALESFDAKELALAARRLASVLRACGKHQETERVARILGPDGHQILAEDRAVKKTKDANPPAAPANQPVVAQPKISGNATCPFVTVGRSTESAVGRPRSVEELTNTWLQRTFDFEGLAFARTAQHRSSILLPR